MPLVISPAPVNDTPLGSAQFRAVIAMVLFIMLGFGLIVPVLPLFAAQFHVGAGGVGLLLTVFAATRLAGDLVAGWLLDRFGERAMAAAGAAIVGLSSLAAGAAQSFSQLVIFRGAGGIGSAFFLGALTAYLIGTVHPSRRGRAMSVFQAAIGIGVTLGPVLGGLIGAISLRAPLFVYGWVAIAGGAIALVVLGDRRVPASALSEAPALPDEGPPAPAPPAWRRLRPLLADSTYRAALFASATGFWISSALATVVSLVWVGQLGLSKGTSGLPFTVLGLTSLLVIWHAGSVSDRLGRKVALVPALGATAVTLTLLGWASDRVTLLILMGILGVATGYARPGPTSMVADVAAPDQRGVAVSGYRTAGDLGALIGPAVAGIVADGAGFRWAFVSIGAVTLVAFALVLRANETSPARRSSAVSAAS